jgi:hypothetical protein
MNSFKNGSGNLDFGDNDGDEKDREPSPETTETEDPAQSDADERTTTQSSQPSSPNRDSATDTSDATEKYPYFVRRNNVGDERDNRLEIHVRNKVTEREAAFRSELAEQLGVDEVPKTDAREFALLDAYQHPERVAERMQEDGFGELD